MSRPMSKQAAFARISELEHREAERVIHAVNDGRANTKDHERLWHDVNGSKLDVDFLKQRVAQLETSMMSLRAMVLEHHEVVRVHDTTVEGLRPITKLDVYRGRDAQGHIIHQIRRHNTAETAYIVEPETGWVGDRE